MLRALLALGTAAAGVARAELVDDLRAQMHDDKKVAAALAADLTAGRRDGCPDVNSRDLTSCFKARLAKMPVTSSFALEDLVGAATAAAKYDKAHGYDPRTARLLLLDGVLTVFEKVDVARFRVSTRHPADLAEYVGLTSARGAESDVLKTTRDSLLPSLEEKLRELEQERDARPASFTAWQAQSLVSARARFDRARGLGASRFPASALALDPAAFAAIQFKDWCESRVPKCRGLTPTACGDVRDRAVRACAASITPIESNATNAAEALRTKLDACFAGRATADLTRRHVTCPTPK